MTFPARLPDLPRLTFGRESFTAACPFALIDAAFYPVSVRQPTGSLAPSFSAILTDGYHFALGFAWVATTNSPEDSHLQAIEHAGHTWVKGRRSGSAAPF